MKYSPPGSSVLGVLQARTVEWVAIPFSRESLGKDNKTICGHCRDQWPVDSDVEEKATLWAPDLDPTFVTHPL